MHTDLSGRRLGKYVLNRVLGRGGMGEVYEALDPETGRTVAIKVLPASLSMQPGYLDRFHQELKLAASLEHIHVLPIYDHGSEDGTTYIVMRYLTGSDLQKRLYKLGRPSLQDARKLLRQIGDALDYAHSRGVVHRDLKPNNIMFDDLGNAYLGDFGIAKVIGTSGGLTGTGQIIGTPYYMAPEQVKADQVDARADLYSFGIIAFQLLTGELPFNAPTPYALMYKHLNDPPPNPSDIRKNLDPRVDTIIERALAKDPNDRYPTAHDFIEDLESALWDLPEGEQSTGFMTVSVDTEDSERTYTPPQTPRSGESRPRKRWPLIGAVLVILVLAVIGTALLIDGEDAGEEGAAIASDTATLTPTITTNTQVASAPTNTMQSIATTDTPTEPPPTATFTLSPSPLAPEAVVDTLEAQETETAIVALTRIETQNAINATLTATQWTDTPTPNFTATIDAIRTERAAGTATQSVVDLTNTATLWTSTPTPTPGVFDPAALGVTTGDEWDPDVQAEAVMTLVARSGGVTINNNWVPFVQQFDGVEMVLVPAGCFMMGSEVGGANEQPMHEICFEESFWIDRHEVTQADFAVLGGIQTRSPQFLGDRLPVENISWAEARDFCQQRGGRLPTESEWEYAARGPDGLMYPWGNEFSTFNVVYIDNTGNRTAPVGSRPNGASWVGAYDLSGNVWEWTNTLYADYPYDANDGRESSSDSGYDHVLRGGAYYSTDDALHSTFRQIWNPEFVLLGIGFRCARDYDKSVEPIADVPTPTVDTVAMGSINDNWEPVVEEINGVEMVLVAGGCFMMGSEDGEVSEQPIHEICFEESFWIDRYEVTQGDFTALGGIQTESSQSLGDRQPVDNISWVEARDFCQQRGGRLPTEAEWEYAARGPDGLTYPWGNEFSTFNAVYADNAGNQTAPVGSRPNGASWVGAYDMSGNVWEWTSTLFADYPYDANDGRETSSDSGVNRVLRGGAYYNADNALHATYRQTWNPEFALIGLGFRCARDY